MVLNIEQDYLRFRQIVRGKIKADLKKYISQGELIGKKGKDFVSIPIPQIEMPNFRFGRRNTGGVGQGEGEPGTALAPGDVDENGTGHAGNAPGGHILEVDLTMEELAQILAEELELPRIQPKGNNRLKTERDRYSQISKVGPEGLRHFKRTYKEALKRQITAGSYDPANPYIVPIHDDKRFLSWKTKQRPESNALIVYIMDVSGSMGDEQKEIVRVESFWIDTWIQSNYKGVITRYLIHDAVAHEVDSDTFFHTRESGGTVISSAYELCNKIIDEEYPQDLWNIYVFHFSDGDNWSGGDTDRCIALLKDSLLPKVNLFGYGQVESTYGSGQFIRELENNITDIDTLVTSRIENKDDIYQSIKDFLGKGQIAMSLSVESNRHLTPELARLNIEIEKYAREYGLDFFETFFEVLDFEEINMVAAYGGFPNRYPHWKFGMEYERLNKSYAYGLHKIYEMVINNDPCYAYLLECNHLVDQKIVMAHVYGHCDFFKNNIWFSKTNRKMMDTMANHATKFRKYIDRYGLDAVESFVDICLSLDDLIDHHSVFIERKSKQPKASASDETPAVRKIASSDYMDEFINPREFLDQQKAKLDDEKRKKRRFPEDPEKDVLLFLNDHAPIENWQRDILWMIREEAYYFAPQAQTKIMNEGWATYWHAKIMTERALNDAEVIDFADHHSGTVAAHPGQINPYRLGFELWKDIEDRWNKGKFGKDYDDCDDYVTKRAWDKGLGLGRSKIFETRRVHNDITFIDAFFTEEFCRENRFFIYAYNPERNVYEIADRNWKSVKQKLLSSLTNFGQPFIYVVDGNFENRGELLLEHRHEGIDLRIDYAKDTLRNLYQLWSRPVHLRTSVEDKEKQYSFDGEKHTERKIDG